MSRASGEPDAASFPGTRAGPARSLGLPGLFDYTEFVRTRFHRFLLLLLMLALPLQAFASAAMLGCAFAHQAVAEPEVLADAAMAGCHASDESEAPPARHDCKHCAVCALASAVPIPASDMPAMQPVAQAYPSCPAAAFSGFVPDGPERPPRLTLA